MTDRDEPGPCDAQYVGGTPVDESDETLASRPLHHRAAAARLRAKLFGRQLEPVRIGRYVLLRPLGAGTMGVVYSAFDDTLDRRVAIKLVQPLRDDGSRARKRMLREAKAMARLSHPNVVQVYEAGVDADDVFIAMELVEGTTLRAELYEVQPRPSWQKVLDAFIAVGEGLAAAHDVGVVHRDFKPDNVLCAKGLPPKVADFGLAGLEPGSIHADAHGIASEDPDLTATGSVLGTPRYMAAELYAGEGADARSDQFAFCVALFEALFGAPPFPGRTAAELTMRVMSGDVARVSERGIPRRLVRAVRRGLAVKADERWPDMRTLVAELRAVRIRRGRGVFVAATLASSIALAGWWGTRAGDDACATAGTEVASVWGPAPRGAIAHRQAAASEADRPVWAEASAELDAYATRWSELRHEGCMAYRAGALSDRAHDLRNVCLDVALARLGALADGLTASRRGPPVQLEMVMLHPESLGECDDTLRLTAGPTIPEPGPERLEYLRLRETLAELRVASAFGLPVPIQPSDLAQETAADDDFRAQVLLVLGQQQRFEGKVDLARQTLSEAVVVADAARNDDTRARASIELVWVLGVDAHEPAAAEAIASLAAGALVRRGGAADLQATLAEAQGMTALYAGRLDAAEEHLRGAVALAEEASLGDAALSTMHANLASVLLRRDRAPEAVDQLRAALRRMQAAVGPDDPQVAGILNNLGVALGEARRHAEALEVHERSLQLRARLWGEDDVSSANALNGIGLALLGLGRVEEARVSLQRSLDIRRGGGGRDEDLAEAEFALARAVVGRDRAEAEALAKSALGRYRSPELEASRHSESQDVATWIAQHFVAE